MMTLATLRPIVDRWLPRLASAYRTIRDARRPSLDFLQTPYGFRFAGNDAIAKGDFEREEIATVVGLLGKATVFVDVGANVGFYSCLAASLGKRVLAFEPLAANLAVLYENLLANGFDSVEVFPIGLSDVPGLKPMFGGGTGASFLPGWANAPTSYRRTVPTSTLDLFVSDRFRQQEVLLKVDVEGWESALLRGATRTLAMVPQPTWFVEIGLSQHFPTGRNSAFRETFEVFFQHGYRATTALEDRRPITREDVERWVASGRVDFGNHNYVFTPGNEGDVTL